MGTQQFLLVVAGIIVVGMAIAVAVTVTGMNAQQSNADAVVSDCLRIASGAQSYFAKPTMFGGGGYTFNGVTIQKCGLLSSRNENGQYWIPKLTNRSVIIIGQGKYNTLVGMLVYSDSVSTPVVQVGDASIVVF